MRLKKTKKKWKITKTSKNKKIVFVFLFIALIIITLFFVTLLVIANSQLKMTGTNPKVIERYYKSLKSNKESSYRIINYNKLDKSYNYEKDFYNTFNHIHISLCINDDYYLLASVTIASILRNANKNSYMHFHIINLDDFNNDIMKKIYSLKSKINNNTEFIFYEGNKIEEDFELGIKESKRGAIDYGRLIIPELIDGVDKIISIDIGNIIVEKDLNDLYNLDLGYFAYLGVIDAYPKCFLESIFNHKEKYVNGGVILLNVKKWQELNLYQYIVKMFYYVLTKTKFYDPYSDIMNDFLPWGSTGFMPLKYNFPDYIKKNKHDQKSHKIWTKSCSYYYCKSDIVIEAEQNVVIRNLYNFDVYNKEGTNIMKEKWESYAELTGFYEEICNKYKC